VHFRSGIGADGSETFTPRTLIYDLKGGFGALRKINALYELEEDSRPKGSWYVVGFSVTNSHRRFHPGESVCPFL